MMGETHSQRVLDPEILKAVAAAQADPIFSSDFHDSVSSDISASTMGEVSDRATDFSEMDHTRLQRMALNSTDSVDHVSDSEEEEADELKDLDISRRVSNNDSPTAQRRPSYASKSEEIAARIKQRHSEKTRRRSGTALNIRGMMDENSNSHVPGMDESNSTHLLLLAQGADASEYDLDGSSSTVGSSNVGGGARRRRASGVIIAPPPPALSRRVTADDVRAKRQSVTARASTTPVADKQTRRHSAATQPRASHLGMTRREMDELQALFADRNP